MEKPKNSSAFGGDTRLPNLRHGQRSTGNQWPRSRAHLKQKKHQLHNMRASLPVLQSYTLGFVRGMIPPKSA